MKPKTATRWITLGTLALLTLMLAGADGCEFKCEAEDGKVNATADND